MPNILAILLAMPTAPLAHPGEQFTHFAGYDLGKATLADVQTRYGKSRVRESGDAGEYEAWICYSTPNMEVQFNSGEMGGGTDLLGFTISATRTATDCPRPKKTLPSQIGDLKLGISKAQFTAIAKDHIDWDKNTGTAKFEYQLSTADGTPLDVTITVIATFRSGKLARLVVWRIETS